MRNMKVKKTIFLPMHHGLSASIGLKGVAICRNYISFSQALRLKSPPKSSPEFPSSSIVSTKKSSIMKVFVIIAALVAVAAAQYDYTPPQTNNRPVYGPPQQEPTEAPYVPQTFRHVYVHTVPDEPVDIQTKTIRVPGGDKHVNIIFVKAPSQSTSQQTEVILPEQDQHKNLVYVLLKKGENTNDVKIRGPAPTTPTKPEVYFIRYKNQEQQQPGPQYGAPQQSSAPIIPAPQPSRNVPPPRSTYGQPY